MLFNEGFSFEVLFFLSWSFCCIRLSFIPSDSMSLHGEKGQLGYSWLFHFPSYCMPYRYGNQECGYTSMISKLVGLFSEKNFKQRCPITWKEIVVGIYVWVAYDYLFRVFHAHVSCLMCYRGLILLKLT